MEIDTQSHTTCEVAADGGAISLGFVDSTGNPATIRLSLNQVGARHDVAGADRQGAADTLWRSKPALCVSARVMGGQASTDPTQGMVTLRTVDGFSVCFSIPRQRQSAWRALVAPPVPNATLRAH
jgi:hypothetical protein